MGLRVQNWRCLTGLIILSLLAFATAPADAQKPPKEFTVGRVILPHKLFGRPDNDSLSIYGHWTLKAIEDPMNPDGKRMTIGAQKLNSTVIRCWRSRGICEEYRASIVPSGIGGILLPLEPMVYKVVRWGEKLIAESGLLLLQIDMMTEDVELDLRRDPSPGRSRIFERWVLE